MFDFNSIPILFLYIFYSQKETLKFFHFQHKPFSASKFHQNRRRA